MIIFALGEAGTWATVGGIQRREAVPIKGEFTPEMLCEPPWGGLGVGFNPHCSSVAFRAPLIVGGGVKTWGLLRYFSKSLVNVGGLL